MPQLALAAVVGAAAATAAAVAAGTVAFTLAATAAYFAKTFVITAIAGYALQELSGDDSIDGIGGADVRGSSRLEQLPVIPKRWILGRSRVRGLTCWFKHLDDRLAYVQILSAGSIDAIERVWINGEELELTRDATTGVITPASGSRFNFTKTTTRTVERYRIVPIGEGGGGGGAEPFDREDPDSAPEGDDGGGGSAACVAGPGDSFASDGRCDWTGRINQHNGRGLDMSPWALARYNEAVMGTHASAGAFGGGGEGGGRVDNPPTQGTVPPGYQRVLFRVEETTTSTVPAIRITEYFAGDGTGGERIRQIAAESAGETATQSNDLEWTTEHKLNDISYVLIELEQPPYDPDIEGVTNRLFSRIPDIEFQVRGIKVSYPIGIDADIDGDGNPDTNPTGDGRLYSTPAWTENAAVLRYWWLTVRRKIPGIDINLSWFNAAVAKCNETIRLDTRSGYLDDYPDAIKRYSINGVLNADDRVDAVEKQFDLCWQGNVVEWGGQFLFRPGAQRSVRLIINPDDIIDHPTIRPSLPRENRINEVNLTLEQSAVEDFQSVELNVVDAPQQAKEGGTDGPIRLPTTLPALAFINQPVQALNFMHQQLRLQRASMEVDVTVMPSDITMPNRFRFVELIPGDRVELNLPEYGIGQGVAGTPGSSSIRYFRVLSNSVNPDLSVNLRLAQWPDNWFFDDYNFPAVTPRVHLIPQPVPPPVLDGDFFITHHIGRDGTVTWEANMRFVPTSHRIHVSAVSPLTNRLWAAAGSGGRVRFTLEDPGTYTFYAFAQRASDGQISAPLTFTGIASLDVVPPVPQVIGTSQIDGNIIKLTLQGGVDRNIDGVEARYTFGDLDVNDLTTIPEITTDAQWNTSLEANAEAAFPRTGDPIRVDITVPSNGIYKIFIRFHNNLDNNSAIVFAGLFIVNQPDQPTGFINAHPEWAGTLQNMAVWPHTSDRRVYASPPNRDALTLSDWNGANAYPFGAYSGTALDADDATRTRYTSRTIDFGRTREVEVVASYIGDKPAEFTAADDPFVLSLQHSTADFTTSTRPTTIMLSNSITQTITARYMRVRVRVTSSTKTALRALELNWRFLD